MNKIHEIWECDKRYFWLGMALAVLCVLTLSKIWTCLFIFCLCAISLLVGNKIYTDEIKERNKKNGN